MFYFLAVVSAFLSSVFFLSDSLDNLNLLFLVPHVALGERPDFASDMKKHTKKQTLFVLSEKQRDDHSGSGQELR